MNFIFDPSLVLYLPLHELDGASFVSKDAYGHLWTPTGAVWRPNGYYFDGADDRISMASIPSLLNLGNQTTYTIMGWFNCANVTIWNVIFGEGNTASNNAMVELSVTGSNVRAYHRDDALTTVNLTSAVISNLWFHAASIRRTSNDFMLMVNGEVKATSTNAPGSTTINTMHIGRTVRTVADGYFQGTISEVLIFNRGLSPLEIQRIYLATKWRYQ